jgi:hypothetical protein
LRFFFTLPIANCKLQIVVAADTLKLMAVRSIRAGQFWRHDQSGQTYLVTKLYDEVLTQYAVLRYAGADTASAETVRLKVQKTSEGDTLPGYTFTQDVQEF